MKSLEHKTNLIFDLFFCIVIMPLLIIIGPARYWWSTSPVFTCLAITYLYGCYFTTKFLRLPELILSKSYYRIGVLSFIFVLLTYLLTLYPLPEMDFIIPSMSEYQTRVRNYNMTITMWLLFLVVMCYALIDLQLPAEVRTQRKVLVLSVLTDGDHLAHPFHYARKHRVNC